MACSDLQTELEAILQATLHSRHKQDMVQILVALSSLSQPTSLSGIAEHLGSSMQPKTLQRRLKTLAEAGLVLAAGERRQRTYALNKDNAKLAQLDTQTESDSTVLLKNSSQSAEHASHPIFSADALACLHYLNTPVFARPKSSYQFHVLEDYQPNQTRYVPMELSSRLHELGRRFDRALAAGTYARQISQRLLIDLSYNSSRLEGNTYSKLDTQNLIEQGITAEGKIQEETVMIMNHKEAILFLIENAEQLAVSPFVFRNIHHLLSQDLLKNPNASGNIRQIDVVIGRSSYLPLSNPHHLEEYFILMLRKAAIIQDPFEQSFFLLLHLSYLQAFEDVNKRTARLGCNIPFIRHNLCPLSFTDVPKEDYLSALLYFYEKNDPLPALELFEWAYRRSCEQYEAVKESMGEIDTFRIQYRAARKEVMGSIIRGAITSPTEIEQLLANFCQSQKIEQQDRFISMTMQELSSLHVGRIIGLGITEAQFIQWLSQYNAPTDSP